MRIAFLCHSIVSDWNHGNAHFLRGVARALQRFGHTVAVFEPRDGWSRTQLVANEGPAALQRLAAECAELAPQLYDEAAFDPEPVLAAADLVVVHEWTAPEVVRRLGEARARHPHARLLFHDTHHRAVSDPDAMAAYDLAAYDGVLAFGRVLRDLYLQRGWTRRAWVWHEAADTTVFRPRTDFRAEADLVWIGNWGDDERADELREYLIEPVRALGLRASVYGVRWPASAQRELAAAGIAYRGWLPNHMVPEVFARHRVTVHVPRRPYVRALPGIPTIRPFEAMACGIPFVSAPWQDSERLFRAGRDFLPAGSGAAMQRALAVVLARPRLRHRLRDHALRTLRSRHTCAHRACELLDVARSLRQEAELTAEVR